jgi:hypothetical protein
MDPLRMPLTALNDVDPWLAWCESEVYMER